MNQRVTRPETLQEACEILDSDEDALVYAGGTAIQILRKQGILSASCFVDISRILNFSEITKSESHIRIGPMVSLRTMETSSTIRNLLPLASAAYSEVANPRVRNTATVGGNISHGDYRLDPPVALLVLDASIELTSKDGTRNVALSDFYLDFQLTAVGHGEIVTAVEIPTTNLPSGSSFVKVSSLSANDWPSASAAAGIFVHDDGTRTLRLGIGALAPTPVLDVIDATGLTESELIEAAVITGSNLMDPIPDFRGSSDFKRKLGVMAIEDAVRDAWKELNHG